MANNNKENVSTTRGVQGGYVFMADTTVTDVPSNADWTPTSAWECLGYVTSDGITEDVSFDSPTKLEDLNLDNVDETAGAATETLQMTLMEVKSDVLGLYYGSSNVTDSAGLITVNHNWGQSEEHKSIACLLILKNDRKMVKYIPDCKVTDRGEISLSKSEGHFHNVTVTYMADANGVTAIDYIESTETN